MELALKVGDAGSGAMDMRLATEPGDWTLFGQALEAQHADLRSGLAADSGWFDERRRDGKGRGVASSIVCCDRGRWLPSQHVGKCREGITNKALRKQSALRLLAAGAQTPKHRLTPHWTGLDWCQDPTTGACPTFGIELGRRRPFNRCSHAPRHSRQRLAKAATAEPSR